MSVHIRSWLRTAFVQAWPYALLVMTFWIVRYWYSGEFGLYEDDLTHLPTAATMSLHEVFQFAFNPDRIINLYGQGHPLHYTFIYLFTNIGWRIGDLQGVYWLGFTIEALNICLFYSLLKRVHSKPLGVLGGLAYAIFSADTTQAYLTFSLGIHTSITLFMLASHAYLSGLTWLTYPLAALMLLTYESAYTVFFAFPLIITRPERRSLREIARHVLVLGMILAGLIAWRFIVGDNRVSDLGITAGILTPIVHMLQGPVVSLGTFLYRPIQTIQGIDLDVFAVLLSGFVLWLIIVKRMDLQTPGSMSDSISSLKPLLQTSMSLMKRFFSMWQSLHIEMKNLVRISSSGLIMLVLAYPLTFTVRAYAISGRDTRVHSTGVIGAAVLIGAVLLLILWIAKIYQKEVWAGIALGVWFGLMAGYGMVIQRDYRVAWRYQQDFWSELVHLLPDVGEGDAILVDPGALIDTRQIGANYWNLPVVLEQLYRFPAEWDKPTWVYRLAEGWEGDILSEDKKFILNAVTAYTPPSTYADVDPNHIILISTEGGRLTRFGGPITIGDHVVDIKPLPSIYGEPSFERGFLYPYLIEAGGN